MRVARTIRYGALAVGLVLGMLSVPARADMETLGPLAEIGGQLELLSDPAAPWDALVVSLPDGDFLQVTADVGPIVLDFPLVTEEQVALEERATALLREAGLRPEIVVLEQGRVLVARLGAVPEAAGLIQTLAAELFGVPPEVAVHYLLIDFGP